MSKKSELTKDASQIRAALLLSLRVAEVLITACLLGLLLYLLGKSIWDLLELLIIPAFLAVIALKFSQAEREAKDKIAKDGQQEAVLQAYFDQMTELSLEKGLSTSRPHATPEENDVRHIARARTLTVVRRLNGEQKGLLVRFLYQSKLIQKGKQSIDLSGADLSQADLSGSELEGNRDRTFTGYLTLSGAQLFGVNLTDADLSEAKLSEANLVMADLTRANLTDAQLMFADLRSAILTGADLSGANLLGANLSGATGLSQKQLSQTASIKDAVMPDGTKVE
jgi:uncharacterized protein YjbI with pentapeptide repeats